MFVAVVKDTVIRFQKYNDAGKSEAADAQPCSAHLDVYRWTTLLSLRAKAIKKAIKKIQM